MFPALASLLVELAFEFADMFDFFFLLSPVGGASALRDWRWDEAGDVDVVPLRFVGCEEEGRGELKPEAPSRGVAEDERRGRLCGGGLFATASVSESESDEGSRVELGRGEWD